MVKPPRSALTVRDMAVALAVLVGVILLLGGVTRSCSFAPGGPTTDPVGLPTVDAPAALRELRARVPAADPGDAGRLAVQLGRTWTGWRAAG